MSAESQSGQLSPGPLCSMLRTEVYSMAHGSVRQGNRANGNRTLAAKVGRMQLDPFERKNS
jgi:hypothetical protein